MMDAYMGFAEVYDRLMDDFDYPAWAEYYLEMLARSGVKPKTVCDCACGTGEIALALSKRDLKLIGVDISREMLELAQNKARQSGVQLQLVCQDMCKLTLPRPVDAIVCACDGVNYLTSTAKLRAFFRSAYAALKPGGALAFDISSAYKLRHELGNAFFGEEREDVAYLWQNTLEGDIVHMDLSFYIRQPDGLYRRVAETHRQRAHEAAEITELLTQCGFEDIRIYGDRRFEAPNDTEQRIHFCALRVK